jgi:hypothetical protein
MKDTILFQFRMANISLENNEAREETKVYIKGP